MMESLFVINLKQSEHFDVHFITYNKILKIKNIKSK